MQYSSHVKVLLFLRRGLEMTFFADQEVDLEYLHAQCSFTCFFKKKKSLSAGSCFMLLFHGTICILKVNLKLSASAPPGMLSSPVQRQPFKMGFIN